MSETQQVPNTGAAQSPVVAEPARHPGNDRSEPTGWGGWVLFSGVIMVVVGGFQATMGLVALFNDQYFLVTSSGLLVTADYTTWGWVHLVLGAVACAAGYGVIMGQTWARVVGILLAVVSAIVNVGFLAAYPIWSTIVIALDVVIIYALAVHGREVGVGSQEAYDS
jgi:hypothetical protein